MATSLIPRDAAIAAGLAVAAYLAAGSIGGVRISFGIGVQTSSSLFYRLLLK